MIKRSRILALLLAFSFVFTVSVIAQQQAEETVVCPVSGKEIKKSEAKITYEYKGKTYYFCCEKGKEAFVKNPEKYTQKKAEEKEVYTCPMHPEVKSDKPGKCPECGMKLEKKMVLKKHMEKACEHMEQIHKKAEEKECCAMMGMMSHKDIELNVEKVENGIAVKITSKNAEVVKKIQEMALKMKEMCKAKAETCKKEEKKEEKK
ncbi:MAG: heavy metal-binding domain-containing protein [Candidatus Aminicenantaceae bacterium]